MKTTTKWLAGISIVAVLVVAACLSYPTPGSADLKLADQTAAADKTKPQPLPSYPAPDFELQTFDGQTVKLSDLKGKPVLINFWASWCNPCKREMPALEKVAQAYKGQVQFYVLNLTGEDDLPNARKFLQDNKITMTALQDTKDEFAAHAYSLHSVPSTFAIDPNGIIVERRLGELNESQMQDVVKRLVDGAKTKS